VALYPQFARNIPKEFIISPNMLILESPTYNVLDLISCSTKLYFFNSCGGAFHSFRAILTYQIALF
jgi:hypothetical protein